MAGSKSKTTTKKTETVVAADKPKVTKNTKTKSDTKKTVKPKKVENVVVENVPVVAPVVAPVVDAPVVNEVVATSTESTSQVESDLTSSFNSVFIMLQDLTAELAKVRSEFKNLKKRTDRELKAAHKQANKKSKRSANRSPSGFVKPTKISPELADFLGVSHGTEMARTEVTKKINEYISQHNLQNPTNGRFILPDAALKTLLKLKDTDELSYFNLQQFMSPHFQKQGSSVPTFISTKLASFLGKSEGVKMARFEVLQEINNYVTANSLTDKDNDQKIIPDSKLKSLLQLKANEELNSFNLMGHLAPHFTQQA